MFSWILIQTYNFEKKLEKINFKGVRKDGLPVAIKKIPKKCSGNLVEFQGNQVPEEFVHQYLASQISKSLFVLK